MMFTNSVFTKISTLPIGTKFRVLNGCWDGIVVEKDGKKYIEAYDGNILKNTFLLSDDYELVIDVK